MAELSEAMNVSPTSEQHETHIDFEKSSRA